MTSGRQRSTCLLLALLLLPTASGVATSAGAEVEDRNVRIVDYGADMCGYVFNPYRGVSPSAVRRIEPFIDKDGNGSLENDTVSGWQFSLSDPLNFPYAPFYDLRQKNARLFGGLMIYAVNNPDRGVSEGMMNANHESRDDFNFMGLGANRPIPADEKMEAYALWCWQKPDFLNDGNAHAVAMNEDSFLAVHVSRYWGGIDAGRWVVRDGDDFYASEATFAGRDELIDGAVVVEQFGGKNPMTRQTYTIRPARTRWAAYHPREATADRHSVIDFDATAATFTRHEFDDVTAAGFLVTRAMARTTRAVWDNLSPHQPLAVKWYAFRCDAVVRRPALPGHAVPMRAAGDDLYLSEEVVSFEQWERTRRIGVTNQYCRGLGDLGYALASDGVIGDMETDGQSHSTGEPVMGITWLDAVAYCNLLSEYEGLEPAYYADAQCTVPLRRVVDRSSCNPEDSPVTVYWKRDSDGFRLPAEAEESGTAVFHWEGPESGAKLLLARNRGDAPATALAVRRSHPSRVSPDPPSEADLRRLVAQTLRAVALPVGVASVEDKDPFRVFIARKAISIARNQRFSGKITQAELDQVERDNAPPDYGNRRGYDLEFGTTEIPYRLWIAVRRWAQTRGYRFNYPGDMGSMRCLFSPNQTFSPDEPVTNICWHDALVWCNALSELKGYRPVYYDDLELARPYRHAVTFRLDTYEKSGYPVLPPHVRAAMGQTNAPPREPDTNSAVLIYLDAAADGYRLPYVQEFEKINPDSAHDHTEALRGQAVATPGRAMRTRSVDGGTGDANGLYELNGNVLEWAFNPLDSYLDVMGKYDFNGYGCFSMTAEQVAENRRLYQDVVYNARPYYGFRVVRRPR